MHKCGLFEVLGPSLGGGWSSEVMVKGVMYVSYLLSNTLTVEPLSQWNPGWDSNGKPGNHVATKSLPSHKIFSSLAQ